MGAKTERRESALLLAERCCVLFLVQFCVTKLTKMQREKGSNVIYSKEIS